MPGMTEPSTWPQMPATHFFPTARVGATMTSQVEVPMIFTMVRSVMRPPTAPMCASNAPAATTAPAGMPSFFAHSAVTPPALTSAVCVSVYRRARSPRRTGSTFTRNSSGGRPPHSACHMAL